MDSDRSSLIREMFSALRRGTALEIGGESCDAENLREKLRDWIQADIVVMRRCELEKSFVIAAPHVSFDNWTQYFANRVAADLKCGEVLARNYRDEDDSFIPVSIGRHIHVNRPTESKEKGGREILTERAQEVFNEYCNALNAAGGELPLALLAEFHAHKRHGDMEVATFGVSESKAIELKRVYQELVSREGRFPELLIEPFDRLRFSAQSAKRDGSMTEKYCRRALHIEIPRVCRESEEARKRFRPILSDWLRRSAELLE